jgi:hypothetical protein
MFKIMRFIAIAVLLAIGVGAAFQLFTLDSEAPAPSQRPGWMQR